MFDEFKRTENEFEFWNDTNILGTHAQRDERITEGRAKKEEVSGCHVVGTPTYSNRDYE